ncbi:MAG: phosphatase PAP2 family protein [Paenisporosarcina sp.]
MESKYNGKLFLLLSSLTGFGFILMAILVSLNLMVRFDKSIINFAQNFETPFLTKIMHFFTYIGSGYSIHTFAFIIFIVFYFFIKNRAELLLFIVVLLGSHYLFRILKQLFKRARPELHRLIEIGGYSFPSGHATNAICIYGVLTFILWRYIPSRFGRILLSTFCIFMVLSIGLSRIYLGVHYPSDVIAGYFAGGFWLSIAIGCFQFVKVKVDVNR